MASLFTGYFLVGQIGSGLLIWLGRTRWLAVPAYVLASAGLVLSLWPGAFAGRGPLGLFSLLSYACFFGTSATVYAAIMLTASSESPLARRIVWPGVTSSVVLCSSLWATLNGSTSQAVEVVSQLSGSMACLVAVLVLPVAGWDKRRRVSLETTSLRIDLTCPRCGELLRLLTGRRRCTRCLLEIALDVREPRCACGFALFRLTGEHCPECGRAIPLTDRCPTLLEAS